MAESTSAPPGLHFDLPEGDLCHGVDDEERFVVLPLLTMTGLASSAPKDNGSAS